MGNPQDSAAVAPTTAPRAATRPHCQYGEKCFRKSPDHLDGFSHPGDSDWKVAVVSGTAQVPPLAGYQAEEAPTDPCIGGEESVEDRGLLGAAGGAAAVLAAGGAWHKFGAFGYSKEQEGAGGVGQFVHDHPGLAIAGGAAAVLAAAFAGHKLEDTVKGGGKKKGGKDKKGEKAKKDKKGGKKDKTKSRELVVGDKSESSSESSSEEEVPRQP